MLFLISLLFSAFLALKIYQYKPPERPLAKEGGSPKGIGGWLILLSVGVLLSPILNIGHLLETLPNTLSYNNWLAILDTTLSSFNSVTAPFIIFSLMIDTMIFIFSVLCVFLFFMKKRIFPYLYISLYLASSFFLLVDHWVIKHFSLDDLFDSQPSYITKSALGIVIWSLYLLKSKRVKATFIH
ncbi:MAG TPA: hypothetical protein DD412_00755 [Holosporales bacterium]|nr:hypothetical protein [Holosporales bacterium]